MAPTRETPETDSARQLSLTEPKAHPRGMKCPRRWTQGQVDASDVMEEERARWLTLPMRIALCLALIALAMVSCGTSLAPTGAEPSEEAPEGKRQYSGTLNLLGYDAGGDPYTWDLDQRDWSTDVYAGLVFEKLIMGDLDRGPAGTGEFTFDQAPRDPV